MRLLPEDELGWTRYAWLVYLAFLFIEPVVSGSAASWSLALGAVVLFLPLYFRAYWLTGRRLLPVVAGIALIGLATSPVNPGGAGFFIYAGSFVGRLGRPRVAVPYLLGVAALPAVEAWLVGVPRLGWVWGVLFTLMIGGINIHFCEVSRGQSKLRLAHDEVERLAKVAERERIGRDLHDLLGHTLSVVTLKAALAARLVARNPERAEREIREVEEIARNALGEVRQAVQGYRFQSLGAELARAKITLPLAGVEVEVDPAPFDLSAAEESAVALALREAVTNVVRHARASHCRIRYRQADGAFRLEVADDGRGGDAPEGSGLVGMRERIEALGGSVQRVGGRGTSLAVVLPLGEGEPATEATA